MKASVIREMTLEEVNDAYLNQLETWNKLRMQHAISPLENPLMLRTVRKDVARLKTELTRRSKEA